MKEELQLKVSDIVRLFDYLYSKENFTVYLDIGNQYQLLYNKLIELDSIDKITEDTFSVIQNVFRLFMEAPPKDLVLGKSLLEKMQEIYLIQVQILNKSFH